MTAAIAVGSVAFVRTVPLAAQDDKKDEESEEKALDQVWKISGFRTGFCIQLLLDANTLDVPFSREARPVRADAVPDLSPALRSVLQEQPQYASWSPSQLCLYYMETVDVGSLRVSERSLTKMPMLGVWSLAAVDVNGGARRDVVLRLFTNTGRLERAGQVSGLDLRKVRSTVEDVENEDDPTAPPLGTRYEIQLGKTLLTWDGRRVNDSTRAASAVTSEWRADSRRRGPMSARLVLRPQWTKSMVGSLRIEGEDVVADAIKASPVRFVAPAILGGGGEMTFGR